jgi:hypothetical protein
VGAIGLIGGVFPTSFLGQFTTDATVLATGTRYLRLVAPG